MGFRCPFCKADFGHDKAALEKLALENERVKEFMKGMQVVKAIVVPGKLVNIVVKPA